jgi:predicted DCC family thiol-disulfide oxidoreductase YuxK
MASTFKLTMHGSRLRLQLRSPRVRKKFVGSYLFFKANHNIKPTKAAQATKNHILVRSAAVIYVMKRLGGMWFLVASLLSLVPRALRDLGYVTCASRRKAILGTTQELCPLVPTQWRARFRD